jgi:hypothetical protein
MKRLNVPGMRCGAFHHGGHRCDAPAEYVEQWVRRDGYEGKRYYCAAHARLHYPVRCVWTHCKADVVAIVDGAPLCAEHVQANEQSSGWR